MAKSKNKMQKRLKIFIKEKSPFQNKNYLLTKVLTKKEKIYILAIN